MKIVVAGGFGAGKTTFVGALSEIPPLATEEYLSDASTASDPLHGVEAKLTTTVSMDYGRVTLTGPQPLILYLFGTPGQERFLYLWDDLTYGAAGAVVLADTRRLTDCFASLDFFEERGIPVTVAVNVFDGAHRYTADEVRSALELHSTTPVVLCDARSTPAAALVVITLVRHALALSPSTTPTPVGTR
ncbi:GTP-binding protein [Streptacidiphilus fuscans]|uniref:GTP-binding protein n=1 Tax=Streptacidiphilus fuscans TaxID=2789292 RepID=UPI0038B4DAEE